MEALVIKARGWGGAGSGARPGAGREAWPEWIAANGCGLTSVLIIHSF